MHCYHQCTNDTYDVTISINVTKAMDNLLSIDLLTKLDFLIVFVFLGKYNLNFVIYVHEKMEFRFRTGGSAKEITR